MTIDVYTANTPNGVKIPIALEELGVPYRVINVNLGAREQKTDAFLRLNPNGRIPVIVDANGIDEAHANASLLSVFESGAILLYLAQRYAPVDGARGLLPVDPVERARTLEYTMFQVRGVGPMFGQAGCALRTTRACS